MKDLGDESFANYNDDISDAATGVIGIQDGLIDSQDYSDMENAVNAILTGYITQDLTCDGLVESADYSIIENNVYFTIVAQRP